MSQDDPLNPGQVQEDDVRVQGDGESGDDITDHGKDDDGCVPPLEHTTHYWDNNDLKT